MPNYKEIECISCHLYFEPTCKNVTQLLCDDHTIDCPHCGQSFHPKTDDVSWMVEKIRTFDVPDYHEEPKKAEKQDAVDKFLDYIDSLPDKDLTDPEVVAEICDRMRSELTPKIEAIDRAEAKRNGAGLFRVVY